MKTGLATLGLALAGISIALAQAPTALPIPFVTTIAGLPAGGSSVACGTTIPTGSPSGTLTGDGCPATQATLNATYGLYVDGYGNIYFGDYNNYALRVIYMGGANLATALQTANPNLTTAPKVGYVYTLAGGRTSTLSQTTGPTGSKNYYCNGAGSGAIALNSKGDNCPGTYAYIKPRNPYVDSYGNVLFPSPSGAALRVVYVGGTQMANLIQLLDNATAQVGYVYTIINSASNAYGGDGALADLATTHVYQERDVAEDSAGNIYMSDGTNAFTAPNYASNNDIRVVNATTGIISTYAGSFGCAQGSTTGCSGVFGGDGGPATSATLNSPYTIFFDRYDNLYITDYNDDRLRVVAKGGGAPVPGLGTGLTAGYIYTVVGGGTATTSGSLATNLSLGIVNSAGVDATGNLYVVDGTKEVIWRVDATTGIAVIIGGGKTGQTKGVYCNGAGTGPQSTDNFGDGCPATQATIAPGGKIAFDRFGNFYEAESGNNIIRKFSYNTLFPATNVGATATQSVALTAVSATTLGGETFTIQGGTTTEFSDAGGASDTCSPTAAMAAGAVCVFGVKFAPAQAGLRSGSLTIATTGTAVSYSLGGDGVAANSSVDPAQVTDLGFTKTASITGYNITNEIVTFNAVNSLIAGQLVTLSGFTTSTFLNGLTLTVLSNGLSGTQFEAAITYQNTSQTTENGTGTYHGGLAPAGVFADSLGNVFLSDSSGNQVVKVAATGGGTATTLMTTLNKPAQVAVDGTGNIYVADTGNNRVAKTGPAGGTITALGTGLSAPQGVAADNQGNVFVADTGNNRIVELPAGGGQATVFSTGLSAPTQIAVDATDNLYVIDSGNSRVVELPVNSEQTMLNLGTTTITPTGIAVDAASDVYLSDSVSGSVVVFAPGTTNSSQLVTGLTTPKGVAVDVNGSLYVADSSLTYGLAANRARPLEDFPNTNIATSNTEPLNVTDTGNATLAFNGATTTTATGNTTAFTITPAATNGCTTSTTLTPGTACGLVATFTPTTKNTTYTETLSLVTNAADAANSGAVLTGTGVLLTTTTTAIAVTQPTTPTINYSQAVTLQFTVTPSTNTGTAPTGTLTYTVDGKKTTVSLPASGIVTVTLSPNPAVGMHSVSASYSGDVYYASSSNSYSFTVQKAVTTTALAISVGAQGQNPTLTFTATVTSTTATGETGMVTFYSGTTPLSTQSVNGSGVATYTTQTTVYNPYSFTAVYSGDANFAGSTSAAVTPSPNFTVVASTGGTCVQSTVLTCTVPQGGVGTLAVNITPLYGYSGTITATCAGLPANTLCRNTPTSLTLTQSGGVQGFSVYIYTNTNSSLAKLEEPMSRRGITAAGILAWPLAALALVWMRRRKDVSRALRMTTLALVMVLAAGGMTALSGCSGKNPATVSNSNLLTPIGTYTGTSVTFVDSSGNSHTTAFTLVINAPYPLP